VKEKIDTFKKRPESERTAVAGGLAVGIMVVLLLAWGFVFFKKLARGAPIETEWGPRTDVVDFTNLKEASDSFSDSYYSATDELRRIRDEAAQTQVEAEQRNRALGNQPYTWDASQGSESGAQFTP